MMELQEEFSRPISPKVVFPLLALLFLALATISSLYLVKQRQVTEQKAAVATVRCEGPMEDVCRPEGYYYNTGDGTGHTWGHFGFNPDDPTKICNNIGKQRQYFVEVLHCLNDDSNKCDYSQATRVGGACRTLTIDSQGKGDIDWDFTVSCGRYQFDICEGGSCDVLGRQPVFGFQFYYPCVVPSPTATPVPQPTSSCRVNFSVPTLTPTPSPTATLTPTPTATKTPTLSPTSTLTPTLTPTGTPSPTNTPTATPTIPPEYTIRCSAVSVYDTNWQIVTDLSSLRFSQTIYLAVSGETNHPLGITKARIRVAIDGVSGEWQETTQKNSRGEFYVSYTIPRTGYYEIEGMVFNPDLGWH